MFGAGALVLPVVDGWRMIAQTRGRSREQRTKSISTLQVVPLHQPGEIFRPVVGEFEHSSSLVKVCALIDEPRITRAFSVGIES
jgi:hypothetical protein